MPKGIETTIAARADAFTNGGAPSGVARRIAELSALSFATDIALVAAAHQGSGGAAAGAFFGVLDLFGLAPIIETGGHIVLADRFDRMALDRALANLMRAQRDLTADVLGFGPRRNRRPPRRLASGAARSHRARRGLSAGADAGRNDSFAAVGRRGTALGSARTPDGLVPEVAHAGEDHRHAGLVGGVDHRLVVHRAAGLDDRRGAGFDRRQHTVGEREERVGRND